MGLVKYIQSISIKQLVGTWIASIVMSIRRGNVREKPVLSTLQKICKMTGCGWKQNKTERRNREFMKFTDLCVMVTLQEFYLNFKDSQFLMTLQKWGKIPVFQE